jgi:hypothetical protein
MKNKFVVSPIVYVIVFQFFREEIREWKKNCQRRFIGANRVVASHFPVSKKATAKDFYLAFKFADNDSEVPSYYSDPLDLGSLELVQKVLNFIKVYD